MSSGFNLNWLQFEKGAAGIDEYYTQQLQADIFPNPITDHKFKIVFRSFISDGLTIQITDINGKTIFKKIVEKLNGKEIGIDLGNIPELRKGIYTLSVRGKEGFLNKKIAFF